MSYLEKISPSYQELLLPLKEWKILNVNDLKIDSDYQGSMHSFYKIIRKLEKYLLIESFINSWSNEKYLYLMPEGLKTLGIDNHLCKMNRDNRYHDSLVVRLCRKLREEFAIEKIYLDFKVKTTFPFLSHIPDAMISVSQKNKFNIALELELSQKTKERITDIFKSYSASPFINNVIFIFNKESVYKSYQKFLYGLEEEFNESKFLFLLMRETSKRRIDLKKATVIHQKKEVMLEDLFFELRK